MLENYRLLLRHTKELIDANARNSNQYSSTYWLSMRLLVAFCLRNGAVQADVEVSLSLSELALMLSLMEQTSEGLVCVAHSNFGFFSVVQAPLVSNNTSSCDSIGASLTHWKTTR